MADQLEAQYYFHKMNELIIQQMCKELLPKIKTSVIRKIQRHPVCVLENYSLKNMWDEISVIIQSGDNAYYDECDDVIDGEIDLTMSNMSLSDWQLSSLWLQTREGSDWIYDHCDKVPEENNLTHNLDDIRKHIREEYILDAAMNWTNSRIERFQESSYDMGDGY